MLRQYVVPRHGMSSRAIVFSRRVRQESRGTKLEMMTGLQRLQTHPYPLSLPERSLTR